MRTKPANRSDTLLPGGSPDDVHPTQSCLLYTSDAADDGESVDLGGRRIIKKNFFKQKTAYEIMPSLVGSEMCIRDSPYTNVRTLTRELVDLLIQNIYIYSSTSIEIVWKCGDEYQRLLADTTKKEAAEREQG